MNNEKASQGAPVEDAERLAEIESICNLEDYQTWNLDLQPHLIWLLNALSAAKREIGELKAVVKDVAEALDPLMHWDGKDWFVWQNPTESVCDAAGKALVRAQKVSGKC